MEYAIAKVVQEGRHLGAECKGILGTWVIHEEQARDLNIGDHVLIRFALDDQFCNIISMEELKKVLG